jgi:hypothetical protein
MHAIFFFATLCGSLGFCAGVYFGGNVRGELEKLHTKADAILAAVRGR